MREVTIIVNPTSGGGRAGKAMPSFVGALQALGVRAIVEASRDARDLRARIAQTRDAGAREVVVAGGDGTLHHAVQELAGSETALAILPVGTGDDNARTLGIPLRDPAGAARALAEGVRRRVDLAEVTAADGTQRYFLGVLSAGFDSFVNERANRMTWPKGKARYVVAIAGELRTFRPVEYTAILDGREIREGAMLVAVGNGVSYGGGMKVCPGAVPDDGLLDVTWLHAVSTPTFIRVFPSVFSGTHVNKPFVSTYRAREIELSAPGQLAYADGERVGPLPISIRLRPGVLSVIVPGRSA
ncbi:MAG: YegS/Rv2252/BmrU family lipid kinase [Actinobacteria bacterium]|nr:YegS/Rv2252/BmrU family lipid kinase [Actinomycetota bacterium]